MQRTYESAGGLVNRAAGPLARHLDPFITSLIEQQYQPSVIYIKARHGFTSRLGTGWPSTTGLESAGSCWLIFVKHRLFSIRTALDVDTNAFVPRRGASSGRR
jgi:hypothetical protein